MQYLTQDRAIKVSAVKNLLKQSFELHQMALELAREAGLFTELEETDLPCQLTIYSYDSIIEVMKEYFNVDITKRSNKRSHADAKHIACYLLKKYTKLTVTEIALLTGNTHHTTAIYAVNKIQDLLTIRDPQVVNDVTALSALIEERFNIQKSKAA